MGFRIEKIPEKEWSELSEFAHCISFNKKYDPDFERIDFTLLAVSDSGTPMGFITCREHTKNQVYWQYGGSFPGTKDTILTYKIYEAAMRVCKENYSLITTLIENTNSVMLKMALKLGFIIVGVKHLFSKTYVELSLNLKEDL